MKIGIIGCSGRMGKTLIREILDTEGGELSGGVDSPSSEYIGNDLGTLIGEEPLGATVTDNVQALLDVSDAVIDFSTPASTLEVAALTAQTGTAHIIGTTGLTSAQEEQLRTLSKNMPVVYASNMSLGVNLLMALTEKVAAILGNDFDIEILEMHHRDKVDAPSGTALALGKAAASGRNVELEEVACKERSGAVGARPKGEIGFATLRGGDVVGDHTVIFASDGERIELTHKASSRQIFARGAVRAALWSKGRAAGLYTMKDVLAI